MLRLKPENNPQLSAQSVFQLYLRDVLYKFSPILSLANKASANIKLYYLTQSVRLALAAE